MASELKIYPSGFLGSPAVPQTEAFDVIAAARQQILNRGAMQQKATYTASADIRTIWTLMCSGNEESKTFDFKERILRAALTHFGTGTLEQWIEAQWLSGDYSDSHQRYVEETLRFVWYGERRQLNPNAWCTLLTAGGNDPVQPKHTDLMNRVFQHGSPLAQHADTSWRSVILRWVRQSGGITDLGTTMQVLFGMR